MSEIRHIGPARRTARIEALLDEAAIEPPHPSASEKSQIELLRGFRSRLETCRLQVAVVGQFKRGKSTLLNAVLGEQVLPTGVVPLTAIPTFLTYETKPTLRVEHVGRQAEQEVLGSVDELRRRLAETVTETGNPHNRLGVARVDAGLPAEALAGGLVLIDTPGIGSMEQHNTEFAVAALPECDAALAVLSPDPPITEAEATYLSQVAQHAARVIPVLNKVDLVEGAERSDAIAYLKSALDRIGMKEAIVATSARTTDAKSGIDEVRTILAGMAGDERRRLLAEAISTKAIASIRELAFQNSLAVAALTAPAERLEQAKVSLKTAQDRLGQESEEACDLLDAEQRRALEQLDHWATRTAQTLKSAIIDASQKPSAADVARDAAFARMAGIAREHFEDVYATAERKQKDEMTRLGERFASRAASILNEARTVARDALGADLPPPEAEMSIELDDAMAWTLRQPETMNPLPPGLVNSVLPPQLRRARLNRYVAREADRLVTLNVERMRWELRQASADAVRRYKADLRDRLSHTLASMADLIDDGITAARRREHEKSSAAVTERTRRAKTLSDIVEKLEGGLAGPRRGAGG